MPNKKFKDSALFRFFKLLFGAGILISVIFVFLMVWGDIPYKIVDSSFNFNCWEEIGSRNSSFPRKYTASDLGYYPTQTREEEAIKIELAIKKFCSDKFNNSKFLFSYPGSVVGASDDSSFFIMYALRDTTHSSWGEFFSHLFIGLIGVVVVFSILGWAFNYIAFGSASEHD